MSNHTPQVSDVSVAPNVNKELLHERPLAAEVAGVLAHAAAALNGGPAAAGPPPPPPPPDAGVETLPVNGRYEGEAVDAATGSEFRLELRVDVEGKGATVRVSGDLFQKGGGVTHWGSFTVARPKVEAGEAEVVVKGRPRYGPNKKAPNVLVTIPRGLRPGPRATVTFFDADADEGETYKCIFASPHFRTAEYEVDFVEGTQIFDVYREEPPGAAAREFRLDKVYENAGVELVRKGATDEIKFENVAAPPTGNDGKWSDSELHSAMLTHFSLLDHAAQTDLTREGQWRLWVLVANEHEQAGMRGMMFDSDFGRQRQGCAVFYKLIAGEAATAKRAALRTYVHEIGHCFNLIHPWERFQSATPREWDSLSFMNYVDLYPSGEDAYWKKFAFEFDADELVHLRHAFRDDIIMGGNFFGANADEREAPTFGRPLNDPGLRLTLAARKSFMLCEPVVVEFKLYRKGVRYKRVHQSIHPDRGFVQLAIRKPDGRVVSYRPMAARCLKPEFTVLRKKQPSVYASAYVGYGRDGFYFDQAGFYQLVAVYHSPCGSRVVSEPLTIRVRNPLNETEEEIADLYYGRDQGALFYLLGSDSKHLASGNRSLDNLLDRHGKHPLAVHAHLVKGVNAGRYFKTVTERKSLAARAPRREDSRQRLSHVVESAIKRAAGGPLLDNITLNMCARRLARAHLRLGQPERAQDALRAVISYFRRQRLRPHVLERIEEQAKKTLAEKY